jgi:hypothetical protein
MKALAPFLLVALAVSACDGHSSSLASQTPNSSQTPNVAAQPASALASPARFETRTGTVADAAVAGFSGVAIANETRAVNGAVAALSQEAPPFEPDLLQGVTAATAAPTMVIRVGQAFIEVDKVDPAVLKIRQLAAQVGGYITNSSISGGRDQIRQATLELKIPAPKYDQAVGNLSTIGKVETVNSNAQDVGEEFVDVTARVNNSRRLEERLLSLLATRTGKLDEVLRVERELARVREEIERYEGRLRYLTARVAMSTLTITVHERAPILGNSPGENPIAAALRRAWKNFIALLAGSIAALGVAIPLAMVGLLGWVGYRRWKRK